MARKSKLPNTLKPSDPDAKTTPQAKREFGFGQWSLYQWAEKGIPALDYEKLPTCQIPGRGPGKPPGRRWCGKTLQRAYDAMHAPIPKGYATWKGIVSRTKLPQSTLRLRDAEGKIDVEVVPRPGRGRRLRKLFPIDAAKTLHSRKPPEHFVDADNRRWITGQHADRTVNGVTYRMLYRAIEKGQFRLIDEPPEVNRDAYPGRTYFLAEQVRRFAEALRRPAQKPPPVPYVDRTGTTWWTICQTESLTGIHSEVLRNFWHGKPASGAGSLLAKWETTCTHVPCKKRIPAASARSSRRRMAFDQATVTALARLNGHLQVNELNGNGHVEQPTETQTTVLLPAVEAKPVEPHETPDASNGQTTNAQPLGKPSEGGQPMAGQYEPLRRFATLTEIIQRCGKELPAKSKEYDRLRKKLARRCNAKSAKPSLHEWFAKGEEGTHNKFNGAHSIVIEAVEEWLETVD